MKLLDAAGRLHLWLLRVLTGILSVFLVLTPRSEEHTSELQSQ